MTRKLEADTQMSEATSYFLEVPPVTRSTEKTCRKSLNMLANGGQQLQLHPDEGNLKLFISAVDSNRRRVGLRTLEK